jgi:hypothetical protein
LKRVKRVGRARATKYTRRAISEFTSEAVAD